jgi:hypothetical protein
MKRIFYPLLIIGLIVSCKSNTKQTVRDSINSAKPVAKIDQDLIAKFKTIIQGVWVKKDYLDKVIKTKSPLAASDECRGITTMYINTNHIQGDSIVFLAGDYNHDSADVVVKFRHGKNPSTIQFNDGDLSYAVEKGDTTITVLQYDERTQQFVTAKYVRVLKRQPDDDLGYGMNYTINKGIIAGSYIMTDTIGTVSKVVFTDDGKVSGFLDCTKYEINIDLNSEPMNNLDEIGFDRRLKTHSSFSFKIDADTLSLYNTYPNADSTELILGKRIYKLVKQK